MTQTVSRDELKALVDGLSTARFYAAERYLKFLVCLGDPFLKSVIEAPWDDEPLTQEDLEAIREANEDIAAGRVISHEELKKELGL